MACSTNGSNSTVQDRIFHAEAAPACKELVWLACNEELEVRSLLFAKGNVENDTCPCCGKYSETTMHALMQCEEAKCIWFGSPLGLRVELLHDITTVSEWIGECASFMDKKVLGMVCVIMWAVWEKRNVWLSNARNLIFQKLWRRPTPCSFQMNGFCLRIPMSRPIFLLLLKTVLELQWEWFSETLPVSHKHVLYSHWNEVIRGKVNSDGFFLDSLLEDCKTMIRRTKSCLRLVGCGGNKVARFIASEAFVYGERVWTEEVMDEATQYVIADVLGPLSLEYSDFDSDSFHDF
ncbi:hypothetical protein DEO72_LG9g530 [Vigna unguiculata]|uniref:Reverse transcriptase zinc-binding domain-containing protein n=1 Tax=Vigna unguiculata TaxID=3917 RepID=A0A4D6N0C4_VIGUN|nr:hypothetical protein DEO72_LG9g530 [Vigna unguiculata]